VLKASIPLLKTSSLRRFHRPDQIDFRISYFFSSLLDSIDDVSKTLLDQVEAFFISYNKQRGKKFKVISLGGPKKALKLLKQGMSAFNDNGTHNSSKSKSSH
jgi:hypothetical protein